MPSNNRIVLAAAGSGKTTYIVEQACGDTSSRAALITYTNNGCGALEEKAYARFGRIPPHVTVSTWYTFLMYHLIRPYQRALYDRARVSAICFDNGISAIGSKKTDIGRHYFAAPGVIYSDKVTEFACAIMDRIGEAPLQRLEQLYGRLFIDESQDLAGYDLDLVERIMKCRIAVSLVGDHRQATYATNPSRKNKKYHGAGIVGRFEAWEKAGLCQIERHAHSHRCIQEICDFADVLHPTEPKTESRNTSVTGHDGMFAVRRSDAAEYFRKFSPQTLRYNRTTDALGEPINYGAAKGMTFDRTMIYPHGPLEKYLASGNLDDVSKSLQKVYVAVTRARQSVAFVVGDRAKVSGGIKLYQPGDV
ncbi:AAA family ATPase [Chitinimonas sp. JJ19]|uniref:AAA family ATPase n=1 Tax=Chitinimonas sp. JJ19 TaxID=3109352 RepID=UPI0030024B96